MKTLSPALLAFLGTGVPTPSRERLHASSAKAEILGRIGGMTRALVLSPERRREIARKAALSRWAERKNRT